MKKPISIAFIASMTVLSVGLPFQCASAADYPEKLTIAIVPFAAGSSNDIMARRISPLLAKALLQQVIIENKPGGNGRIGIEALAKAPPDGYTILFSGGAIAVIPAVRKNV